MGATKDLQYKRLNELIFDEEQIVTSLFIANELKIPQCEVQNLLTDYVNNVQQKSEDFHVTYLLSGTLKDGKGVAIYLVKEDDLKEKKCLFDNVSSEIIYSIQKGKLINFNAIASINSVYEDGTGFLVSRNCVKRDIKSKKLPVLQPSTTKTIQNNSSESSTSGKSEKHLQENGKNHTQSSQKQLKPKRNGGIASFFAKAPLKNQSNTNSEPAIKNEPLKQNVDGNIKQKVDGNIKQNVDGNIKQNTNIEQNIQKDLVSDEKVKINNDDPKDQKPTTLEGVNEGVSKKRKKQNKNNGPNKKRKRIQEICDSDSSDIFEEESEDIIEMSDDEPVPTPVVNSLPVTKNKKRKAVDKTYVDEEGFIVTTTEYIYESASEDEEKNASKPKPEEKILSLKNEKTKVEHKLPGNKGGKSNKKQTSTKQPTLMSFFKKS